MCTRQLIGTCLGAKIPSTTTSVLATPPDCAETGHVLFDYATLEASIGRCWRAIHPGFNRVTQDFNCREEVGKPHEMRLDSLSHRAAPHSDPA